MTIPQQLADQRHTLFSPVADAARWGDHPLAIETQDHGVIRSWAECHGLSPAALSLFRDTEDLSGTGQDGLTPPVDPGGPSPTWAEWLTRFDALGLSFVFEATMATRRLARTPAAPGTAPDAASDGRASQLHVDAASTGRFRIKRARVGF